ncbi:hypothetical protein BN946_scf184705.g9 [Trametes cinnabarina]|uniref:Rhodanese domain-containing protein n=1 Tax=Pycnoporus cinnabarinus TaxID=5643 RepID=A0A060SY64_PYCCI|nr:hypothetical protein BN946_scf184705.g9 [Trametes cinnabarina]
MASSSVEPSPSLPLEDYRRYGRQMILDGFGLEGTLGVIDHDTVQISNLQRQVLHTEDRVGMAKVLSAAEAIRQMNSRITVNPITAALTSANAVELLAPYDLILDCTDNLPTRYLLSDTAVELGKPLVSGAAQQFDGQLCVYNLPLKSDGQDSQERGPCFRCLFPKPPAPEMAGSCEELGVLGAVTGVIGNLQALEAIKLLAGLHDGKPSLLMFSALGAPPFRSVKLRSRRPACPACGVEGEKVGRIEETDYVAFCGGERPDWVARGLGVGDPERRVHATELKEAIEQLSRPVQVLDVRPRTEFEICHLPGSTNVPIKELLTNPSVVAEQLGSKDPEADIYVVCRLGNDSQLAVHALRDAGRTGVVKDLIGGLRAWAKEVDGNFPIY